MPGRLRSRLTVVASLVLVLAVLASGAGPAEALPAPAPSEPSAATAPPVGPPFEPAWRGTLDRWIVGLDATDDGVFTLHGLLEGGTVSSIDPADGHVRWATPLPSWPRNLLVADDLLYVVAYAPAGSQLTALDVATGAVVWRRDLAVGPSVEPVLVPDRDVLVFRSRRDPFSSGPMDAIRAFDARTGALRWAIELEASAFGPSPLAVEDGILVLAGARELRAVEPATGATLWRLTSELDRGWSQPMALGSGRVAVAHGSSHVYDVATGVDHGVIGSVVSAPTEGVVVTIGAADASQPGLYGLVGVDAATGAARWRRNEPGYPKVVGDPDGRWFSFLQGSILEVVDPATGETVWQTEVPDQGYGLSYAAAGGGMLALAGHTEVFALRPSAGAVTSVAPDAGPPGTPVTVRGYGLDGATGVRFGGVAATEVTVVDATTVTARTPALPPGEHLVTATGPDGQALAAGMVRFRTQGAPRVDAVVPPVGRPEGGTAVVLHGSGLSNPTAVHFGLLPALSFQSVSDTELQATAPPGVLATDVLVTTAAGRSTAGAGTRFEYVPTPAAVEPATTWRGNPAHDGHQPTPLTLPLAEHWRVDFGDAAPSYPVIAEGKVFVVAGGLLRAIDAGDGSVVWGPRALPVLPQASIGYGGGKLLVATVSGVEALDAETGRVVWIADEGHAAGSPVTVTVADGTVYTSENGLVTAIDLADGSVKWRYAHTDGATTPTVGGGVVAISSTVNGVTALDPATGAVRWRYSDFASGGGPAADESVVYADGRHWRRRQASNLGVTFDAANGAVGRSYPTVQLSGYDTPPAFVGGLGLFPADRVVPGGGAVPGYELQAIDLASWTTRWKASGPGQLLSGVVTDGAHAFVGTREGEVLALDLADGSLDWRDDTGAPVGDTAAGGSANHTSPAIGGGLLVVPSGTGLVAYGAPVSVTSVSPRLAVGPLLPVTITGSGLTGAREVTFNGRPAASFTVASDTRIVATAPLGVLGPGDVRVRTASGISPVTAADRYGLPIPTTIPTLPSLALDAGDGFLRLAWEPAPGEGALGYVLVARFGNTVVRSQIVAGDVRTASLGGLVNGRAYDVSVTAILPVGYGAPILGRLAPDRTRGAARPPDAPREVAVVAGDANLSVRWSPPAFDGGAPVTVYSVIALDGSGRLVSWRNVPADQRAASIASLRNGQSYTVHVAAWNAQGFGAMASLPASRPTASRPATPPSAPIWVTGTAVGSDTHVYWGPPADEGGAPVTASSVVAMRRGSVIGWVNVGADARSAVLPGIGTRTDVSVTVIAASAKGFGTAAPLVAVNRT